MSTDRTVLITGVTVCAVGFARPLLVVWMGPSFETGVVPFYILAVTGIVLVGQGPLGNILLGTGRHRLVAFVSLGEALANLALLFAVELVSLPVFGIFYNVPWTRQFWPLIGVVLLGTWGITVIGTIFSAMTVNMRLRELMLPMLVYPIMIPGLLAAVQLTTPLVMGQPLGADSMIWLRLLVAYDVIFTALALALVETVLVR
jgi:ABC-type transport system involved in cytochrome c biogenesis permease component